MHVNGETCLFASSSVRAARQGGGTFLGFLLGMLFGLAVALGVAVYITKVPLPFMNKNLPRSADDPADAKKMKEWDPNAGLPGRQTKPEVPPPSEPAAASAAAEAAAPVSPAAPAGAAVAPPAKSADPLGELARSRAEAPPPASAPARVPAPAVAASPSPGASTEPFQYFVQAGAYRSLEDAEQQRAKLSLMGLQSKLSERDQAGRMVYRVRLGPFERREEADKARDSLVGNNIEAVVVRLQR
jgi:cell division protein FtsN